MISKLGFCTRFGPRAWAAVPQSERAAAPRARRVLACLLLVVAVDTANPVVLPLEPRTEWCFMVEIKSEHSECPHLTLLV